MGYLNNQTMTISAILTSKGRSLLAKGEGLNITQFALADDEIDYDLYNPAHPQGSDFYDVIISNLPMVEPVPDETQMMKHKLVTLSKKTTRIPVVQVGSTSITLNAPGDNAVITPSTSNFPKGNSTLGYTAVLSDSDAAILRVAPGNEVQVKTSPTVPRLIGDSESPQSVYVTGKVFEIIAKSQPIRDKTCTVTVIGNETGGRVTIDVTVKKTEVATAGSEIAID